MNQILQTQPTAEVEARQGETELGEARFVVDGPVDQTDPRGRDDAGTSSRTSDEVQPRQGEPRIVAVNRFYAPDHSATAQLLTDLAEHLAQAGTPVTVITSRLEYDDPNATLPPREQINGVIVRRVWTTRFGRAGLWGRALDYATFYFSATLALLGEARVGDTILAKTDPPLISVPAAVVARLKRARLVNWCQDVFPEIAASLGMRWAGGPIGALLRRLRNWSLRAAKTNVVLCNEMRQHLMANSVSETRIRVIHNWPDVAIHPVSRSRRRGQPFTICYSGNLGRAHNIAAVIELIDRTWDIEVPEIARCTKPAIDGVLVGAQGEECGGGDDNSTDAATGRLGDAPGAPATASVGLLYRFVGGGAGTIQLRQHVRARRIAKVSFEPYVPRHNLARSLARADLHLVSLDPACEGLIMPSKIYGILATGRPTLFLGHPAGSVARMLRDTDAGLALDITHPATWCAAIKSLIADPARMECMGRAAHEIHQRHYAQPHALAAWRDVLAPAEAATGTTPQPKRAAA